MKTIKIFSCFLLIAITAGLVPPRKKDVIFILDTSGSIGIGDFKIMLDKCKEIVDDHTVGLFDTLFGLDVFSTMSKTIIKLKDYTKKYNLKEAIDRVKYEGGFTNTFLALNRLVSQSFTYNYGHRPGARKIAVVMTDGKSQMKTKTINAAKKAKEAGIEIIAIGIGNTIDWDEILAISSGGESAGAAFKVSSYSNLKRFNIKKLAPLYQR